MNDAMRIVPDTLFFSKGLLGALTAEAASAAPRETGGLLLGREAGRVRRFVGLPNGSLRPERHFRAEIAAYLRAVEEARGAGRRVLGLFHSHPHGAPLPSREDLNRVMEGLPLVLVGRGEPAVRGFVRRGSAWIEVRLEEANDRDGLPGRPPCPPRGGIGGDDRDRDFI